MGSSPSVTFGVETLQSMPSPLEKVAAKAANLLVCRSAFRQTADGSIEN